MNRISFCHDIRDSFSFVRKENESLSLSLSIPKTRPHFAILLRIRETRKCRFSSFFLRNAEDRVSSSTLLSFENIFRSMIAPRDRNDNEKRIRSILLP